MLYPALIAFAILSSARSIEEIYIYEPGDPPLLQAAFDGYPIAITCDHAFSEEWHAFSEESDYFGVDYDDEYGPSFPSKSEDLQCVIRKNDDVIYNERIHSDNRKERGYFGVADESWKEATIEVQAIWNSTQNDSRTISIEFNPVLEVREEKVETGKESEPITCGNRDWPLSDQQFNNLSVVWYRGSEEIKLDNPDYKIIHRPNEHGSPLERSFSQFQVLNASLRSTPGIYNCTVHKTFDAASGTNTKLVLNSVNICMKRPYSYSNQPQIKLHQTTYESAPGSDVTITVQGHSGVKDSTSSKSVLWYKFNETSGEFDVKCFNIGINTNENCTEIFFENPTYCKPLSEEQAAASLDHELNDNFTANFTLRHLTKDDEGLYKVELKTSKPPAEANFTVTVRHPTTDHRNLTIALSVIGVFILIGVIALLILNKYRTDVRYLYKKIFNGKALRDTRPVAYLVYSSDVFKNPDKNPYRSVLHFLGGRRFYDPSNPGCLLQSAAGRLEAEHIKNMLKQCMTMMVFVTNDLLSKTNEEIEAFEAYRGFNESIQNKLPIIFICTKGVKVRENLEEFNNNNVVAFRAFMRMRRNTVIEWDKRHPNRFRRALYAALPNVLDPGVDELTRV